MHDSVNHERSRWIFAETHSIIANPQAQLGWLNVLETLHIAFTCTGESVQRSQNSHGGFPDRYGARLRVQAR